EDETDRPESITVQLYQNNEKYEDEVTITPDDKGQWIYTFADLELFDADGNAYTYDVKEINVDEKYEAQEEVQWDAEENSFVITNVRTGTTEVSGEKTWKDTEETAERPESITVRLYADGEEVEEQIVEPNADDEWAYNFTSLAKYDEKGKEIEYLVTEDSVDGYLLLPLEKTDEGFDLINVRDGKTEVTVEKIWHGPVGEAVTINLLANGKESDSVDLTKDDWTHTFVNLDKYDSEGKEITYTVDEVKVENYSKDIAGDAAEGFTITNTHTGKVNVDVTKEWELYEEEAQAIEVDLLQNGDVINTVKLDEENKWKHTFEGLDEYDAEGKLYVYEVEEVDEIEGFEVDVSGDQAKGYVITNTEIVEQFPLEPGKTEVTVDKVWKGEAEEEVTIHLLEDGEKVDEVTLSEG